MGSGCGFRVWVAGAGLESRGCRHGVHGCTLKLKPSHTLQGTHQPTTATAVDTAPTLSFAEPSIQPTATATAAATASVHPTYCYCCCCCCYISFVCSCCYISFVCSCLCTLLRASLPPWAILATPCSRVAPGCWTAPPATSWTVITCAAPLPHNKPW